MKKAELKDFVQGKFTQPEQFVHGIGSSGLLFALAQNDCVYGVEITTSGQLLYTKYDLQAGEVSTRQVSIPQTRVSGEWWDMQKMCWEAGLRGDCFATSLGGVYADNHQHLRCTDPFEAEEACGLDNLKHFR